MIVLGYGITATSPILSTMDRRAQIFSYGVPEQLPRLNGGEKRWQSRLVNRKDSVDEG